MSSRKNDKPSLNLVVVGKFFPSIQTNLFSLNSHQSSIEIGLPGHVDAGKSTLMGHLLIKTGEVTKKDYSKNERESQKIGKSSFALAWSLDETEEERKRFYFSFLLSPLLFFFSLSFFLPSFLLSLSLSLSLSSFFVSSLTNPTMLQ